MTPDEVLAFHEMSTECGSGAWPVPVMVTEAGEFVALLTKLTLPLAAPEICGAKLTFTVLVAPAAIASGKVIPLMV